jgi:Fe-S cluster assembly protein SufD
VLLLPLSQAAREHEALVRERLHSMLPAETNRFTALSAALWTQGILCYVPKRVAIEGSLLHLIGKSSGDHASTGHGLFGQTLFIAEEGAAVTLIEASASDDGPAASLLHRSVEVLAGPNSDVRYVCLQNWGADACAFVTQQIRAERDARVLSASAAFGGALSRERIVLEGVGEGINAELVGLFVGTDAQHIEYDTRQDHLSAGGTSDLQIKGALDDHAMAVQYGVVKIAPEAQKTSGQQTMRNLLLSAGAGADPIPVLEIEADDVKCSHAAAVGPVDPEQIFYLQSRGIPPDDAERMVVQGFLDVVAQRLPDADLRESVERIVEAKLDASGRHANAGAA